MKKGLSAVAALKTYGFMAGGFALVATVVGVFTAGPAIAQAVRAALVSNVDDPGRIPYAGGNSCNFDGFGDCSMHFPPVPAGKRLVITHVSGVVQDNLPVGTYLQVSVNTERSIAYLAPTYNGAIVGGLNTFVFDQSVLLFADAGEDPPAAVGRVAGFPASSNIVLYLSGYMLDCSNGPCAKVAP